MVEGEKERLGPLQRRPAGLAPELLAVPPHLRRLAVAQDLHDRPAAAFAEGLLEGPGQARLGVGAEDEPVEHHVDALAAREGEVRER